jgi:hypothetical protein
LAIGGSIGPKYVLKLLFSEKTKIADNSTITEVREKYASPYLEGVSSVMTLKH